MAERKSKIGIISGHPFLEKWSHLFHATEVKLEDLSDWQGDFLLLDFRDRSWTHSINHFVKDLFSELLNFHLDILQKRQNRYHGTSVMSEVITSFYNQKKVNYIPKQKVYLIGNFNPMLPLLNAFFSKGHKQFSFVHPECTEEEINKILKPFIGIEWQIIERHHIVMESAIGAVCIMSPNYESQISEELKTNIHYFNYLHPKATVIDLNTLQIGHSLSQTVTQIGLNYISLNEIFEAMQLFIEKKICQ